MIAGRTHYSFLAGMATRYSRAFIYFLNSPISSDRHKL